MLQYSNSLHSMDYTETEFASRYAAVRGAILSGNLVDAYQEFGTLLPLDAQLIHHKNEVVALQDQLLQATNEIIEAHLQRAEKWLVDHRFDAATEILNETLGLADYVTQRVPYLTPARFRLLELTRRAEALRFDANCAITSTHLFELRSELDKAPEPDQILTPKYLLREVAPFLDALSDIQNILDSIEHRPKTTARIRLLTQNSPISISLDGVAKAVEVVLDTVVPWRREHAAEMARLKEQEVAAQIEKLKVDAEQIHATAQRQHSEARKVDVDTDPRMVQVELDRRTLENELCRIEIEAKKLDLAIKIVEQFAPDLDRNEKRLFGLQFMRPLGMITESSLLITPITPKV